MCVCVCVCMKTKYGIFHVLVTLLRSFHRGTLSIHWYIAQNL